MNCSESKFLLNSILINIRSSEYLANNEVITKTIFVLLETSFLTSVPCAVARHFYTRAIFIHQKVQRVGQAKAQKETEILQSVFITMCVSSTSSSQENDTWFNPFPLCRYSFSGLLISNKRIETMVKASTCVLNFLFLCACCEHEVASFSLGGLPTTNARVHQNALYSSVDDMRGSDEWQGAVVPGGTIRGCSVTPVGDSITDWVIQIDGVEADLGRFSEAIYKHIMSDAKRQSFQGFRPGTIPPHLLKTYRAYAMDECARETVLEAMQQNNIRPFTTAREEIKIEQVSIPPSKPKKTKKKKKNNKKKNKGFGGGDDEPADVQPASMDSTEPQWQFFESMDKAIKGGWEPGQSFSFVATNVKGQNVLSDEQTRGALPLNKY